MSREVIAAHAGQDTGKPAEAVKRYRLLVIGSHVVQYSSPVFRQMVSDGRIDLRVVYCSMQGVEKGVDPEFGVKMSWDTPVLEGYPWAHVPNRSPRPGLGSFFGLINPGLWALIRDGKFDAVYVSGYFYASAWIAIAAAKWHGIPVIFTTDAYGLRSLALRSKWKLQIKRIIVSRIYAVADVTLAMSSGTVEYLKSLGVTTEHIVKAPLVVDNDWWIEEAKKADRNSVRVSWRIPIHGTVVLFCAKLQPWKRPADLLEAFTRANVPESYLVFAGDGPLRNELEKRAEKLDLTDRVRFLGFLNQSQLPGVYCASDLLVLPSEYDSFGLVVNEAMLCGRPVAVSDQVGAKFDLVRYGENGYVFRAGDVDQLAAILREILADPEKRAVMGLAARRRMETWSPREFVDGVVCALQQAAKAQE